MGEEHVAGQGVEAGIAVNVLQPHVRGGRELRAVRCARVKPGGREDGLGALLRALAQVVWGVGGQTVGLVWGWGSDGVWGGGPSCSPLRARPCSLPGVHIPVMHLTSLHLPAV